MRSRVIEHHFNSVGINCFARSTAASAGSTSFALFAAAVAAFFSFSDLILRIYAKRTMKSTSILSIGQQYFQNPMISNLEGISHLSLVIMSMPCTSMPLVICGTIPLNNAKGPS